MKTAFVEFECTDCGETWEVEGRVETEEYGDEYVDLPEQACPKCGATDENIDISHCSVVGSKGHRGEDFHSDG